MKNFISKIIALFTKRDDDTVDYSTLPPEMTTTWVD